MGVKNVTDGRTNGQGVSRSRKAYKLTWQPKQVFFFSLVKIGSFFTFFNTWVLAFLPTVAKAFVFSKKAGNWQASLEVLPCIGWKFWLHRWVTLHKGRRKGNRCVQNLGIDRIGFHVKTSSFTHWHPWLICGTHRLSCFSLHKMRKCKCILWKHIQRNSVREIFAAGGV